MNIDSLIDTRETARVSNNYALSDKIRDKLEKAHVFVFDTREGQVVYHEIGGTRKDLENKLNRESRAEILFDAWLFSHKRN